MTFKHITLKIFKANLRKYLLYFLSSSFAMIMFFIYSTIYTNKKLMNSPQMSSEISSMLKAPSVLIVLFSFIFIIYAHKSFLKHRKNDFGLLMVLGMTDGDIRKIIFIENIIIAISSLSISLVVGTLFSRIFYFVVLKIANVKDVPFVLSVNSYLYTIVIFSAIYILVILSSLITTFKFEIINLIKEPRKADKNFTNNPLFGVTGITLIGLSFFYFVSNFKVGNDGVFIKSIFICFFGIYLFISNIAWFITKLLYSSKNKYLKNLLFISDIKYSLGQSKKILFLITIFITVTIFCGSFSVTLVAQSKELATSYNPYHVAYVEFYGKNNISDKLLNSIIEADKTPLIFQKTLEFIDKKQMTILSDEKLNATLGSDFHVQKGHFIYLSQIVKDDGYVYEDRSFRSLNIESNNVYHTYVSQGEITKVVFNRIHALQGNNCIILNDNDYLEIKLGSALMQKGTIRLMNFENWYDTKKIVDKLSIALEDYNTLNTQMIYENNDKDKYMFKIGSRIGDYMEGRQAGSFLMFLLSFIAILFFVASCVMLHFKLLTEFAREQLKYKKLYKIGITKKAVSEIIAKELKVLFFLPFLIGSMVANFYSCFLLIGNRKEMMARSSLSISVIYFIVLVLYYVCYKKKYINKFLF